MTWDTAGDRPSWTEPGDDCASVRKIPELLAEQVEAADLLLVNKVDLAGREQVKIASGLAKGLNDKAGIVEVEFGRVEAKELLGTLEILKEEAMDHDHGHEHSHGHSHEEEKCMDADCKDESHSHSHSHEHSSESSSCSEPGCTDTSHSHSHDHNAESSCADPSCTDTSHSHSHDHSEEGSCSDPDCTDASHSHSHSHSSSSATSTDQLGITSFVYKQSKPFNSQRLLALLNRWPLPIKDSLDLGLTMGSEEIKEGDEPEEMAFAGVLRSKGFCWMAPQKWSGGAGSDGE
jgi:G3E family GTPase